MRVSDRRYCGACVMFGLVETSSVEVCGQQKLGVNPAKSKVIVVEMGGESDYSVRICKGDLEGMA